MTRHIAIIATAWLLIGGGRTVEAQQERPATPEKAGAIQHATEDLHWVDGPPSLPPGAKIMVLEGNPRENGLFTIRLKLPAGTRIEPHWHPRDERVTVVSGSVWVGFGDTFDTTTARQLRAGSYYVNPPLLHHFLWIPEETVLQMTNMGPWELTYVHDEKK